MEGAAQSQLLWQSCLISASSADCMLPVVMETSQLHDDLLCLEAHRHKASGSSPRAVSSSPSTKTALQLSSSVQCVIVIVRQHSPELVTAF